MMTIWLNGEQRALKNTLSLQDALNEWGYNSGDRFSVAVNGNFVARAKYSTLQLQEKDYVDVVTMVQGG